MRGGESQIHHLLCQNSTYYSPRPLGRGRVACEKRRTISMVSFTPSQRDTEAGTFLETIKMVPLHLTQRNPDLKGRGE